VVLISGQSNADGRAAGSDLPTTPVNYQAAQDNVPLYSYIFGAAANGDGTLGSLTTVRPGKTQFPAGGFGPEVGMAYSLAQTIEQQPGTALAIIKYAKGGSSLVVDWKAGGNATTTGDGAHYVTFQQVVTAGLAKLRAAYPDATVKLAAMIWVQGESDIDAGAATSAAYGANLTTFISDVRATFDPALPFFLSRISSSQTVYSAPADADYANYLTLRTQQEQVAANVPGAYLVSADGAAFTMNSDFLHFNAAGQLALGKAFAASLADVLRLRVTSMDRAGANPRLFWNAIPGKSYRVFSSPDLTTWTPQDVGAVSTWTDPAALSTAPRYYRVSETP
jgi:lysophospholipase L1-like esterase